MRINHNVTAQLANINLKKTNKRLTSSLESLSSGYKINSAADDSAGLAISNKMRTQIRALEQSSRNAEDGTSIIQTAEGALSEVTAILQRVRELSVQSANDTNTLDDREAMQVELDKMLEELDRIGSQTEFNGNGLLDGSFSRVVTYDAIGLDTLSVADAVPAGNYTVTITQTALPAETDYIPYPTSGSIQINNVSIELGENPVADITKACDRMDIDVDFPGNGTVKLTTRATGIAQKITTGGKLPKGSVSGKDAEITLGNGTTSWEPAYSRDGKNITIKAGDGFEIRIEVQGTTPVGVDKDGSPIKDGNGNIVAPIEVNMRVYDDGPMILQIGANEHQNVGVTFPEISCQTLGLKDEKGISLVNICSQGAATSAIQRFDDAIRTVSEARSDIGAHQNRLDSTIESLDTTSENLTGALSRIMDTDMAAAMTNYTQESVLVQASTAILSQANNRPQQILSLLQS